MNTPNPTRRERPIIRLKRYLPILAWLSYYDRHQGKADLIAGLVVLFITVPQVIAYAFLAGLPPQMGLFAAIAALLSYACFGTSRSLAVGPTAVIAMMTLQSASQFAEPYSDAYVMVAMELAMMTGIVLLFLRAINFGAVVSFLSHAVVTAFISAAAILIIVNQLPAVLGVVSPAQTGIGPMFSHLFPLAVNWTAVIIAVAAMGLLLLCRHRLCPTLVRLGVPEVYADNIAKASPMLVVILGIVLIATSGIDQTHNIEVVGELPLNLPLPILVSLDIERIQVLLPSSLLIAMVVFLESTSIATAMASRRREKINPNQELIGLGFANSCASVMGGFPVAGSFARTVVNDGAGAQTPIASLVTAVLVIMTLLLFGALFYYLPKGVLSAIVVVSAIQLIDLTAIKRILRFNSSDAVTFVFTFVGVLVTGVETGILLGILISFALLIRNSSRPHIAVVGRWENTEHFRNVLRHEVTTDKTVLAARIDESLYFVNTRFIETFLMNRVAESPDIRHVLLICTATNFIDSSGLDMLEVLSDNLEEAGVTLHLSEVKGPVMDRLSDTHFYRNMKGKVFFTTDIAMRELAGI
tara:strand:+ start:2659 stop:4407 length:1749 start_codon:yes stop_codon:yes gene_type:complete